MKNQKGSANVIVSFIIVACIIGLVVYGLLNIDTKVDTVNSTPKPLDTNKKEEVKDTQNQTSITKPMEQNSRLLPNFTPVAHTAVLQKIDIVVGKGDEVKAGDKVSVHYTGAVAATGVIFQSSKDFGLTPVTFPLDGVIKGWTDGIPGMKVGGVRRLVIPAAQAYGANPPQGSGIPANADLVFDVELTGIQ